MQINPAYYISSLNFHKNFAAESILRVRRFAVRIFRNKNALSMIFLQAVFLGIPQLQVALCHPAREYSLENILD